jgi:hypothetical protein
MEIKLTAVFRKFPEGQKATEFQEAGEEMYAKI